MPPGGAPKGKNEINKASKKKKKRYQHWAFKMLLFHKLESISPSTFKLPLLTLPVGHGKFLKKYHPMRQLGIHTTHLCWGGEQWLLHRCSSPAATCALTCYLAKTVVKSLQGLRSRLYDQGLVFGDLREGSHVKEMEFYRYRHAVVKQVS